MKRHLPNLISALRFPLAGAFVAFDGISARLLLIAVAAASDWVDGRLARATGTTSRTGEWLDPVADKIFMVVAVVTLTIEVGLPFWVLPLLLLRDIGVVIGAATFALLRRRPAVRARRAGKWVTWLQFLAVGLIALRPALAPWIAPPIALVGAVALLDYWRAQRRAQPPASAHDPQSGAG